MIQTNEFQTALSEELLNSLNDEVKTELLDAINNIRFIQNLISPTRKRAKDLPRDSQGRIIVDIVNPHILEDMDYFRPSAIHFQKYGKYTNLRPNRNPNSEYYKWITQEKDRCWNGMIRESDGEWIPGYYYFYLNYQPIIQTKVREGTNQGDRVTDFPLVWEGGYLAFHYLDQARNGGLYNDFKGGQHGVEIAKRGASKAHPLDAIVPTTQGFKKWGNVKIGDYLLTPDGETTKIIDEYKFYNSSIYKLLLENGSSVECSRSHLFETYYKGDKYLKSVDQIIELVTNLNNLEYSLAMPEPVYLKYQPVKVDPYIIGQLLCNPNTHKPKEFKEELNEINFKINVFPQEYLFNSVFNRRNLLKGLLDSKGYVKEGIIRLDLNNKNVTLTVNKLIRSLGYNSSITQVDKIYTITIYTNDKLFSNENVNNKINCIDKEKIYFTKIIGIEFIGKKPAKCVTVDQPDGLYLIEDFIVTHNSYSLSSMMARNFILGENERSQKKVRSVITAFEKESLTKDATLNKFVEVIDFCSNNTEFPRQRLRDSISDMNWIMGYKDVQGRNKGTLNEVQGVSTNFNPDKARGKRANLFGYEEFGKFPKFIDTWNVNKPSIEEDDVVFGLGFAIGCVCAGTKVYNKYGELINIEDITKDSGILGYKNGNANVEPITYIQDPLYKECIEIQTNNRILKCSLDHPILTRIQKSKRINSYKISNKRIRWYENKFVKSNDLKIGDFINVIDKVDIWGEETLFDARLVGMLIGDGSYGMRKHYNKIEFKTPSFSNCDSELLDYVINNYKCNIELIKETKDNRIYKELSINELIPELKKIGIAGQSKNTKRLPINFNKLNKQNTCDLIAGLFDTDGCVYVSKSENKSHDCITLTQSSKEILEEILILLNKLGIYGKIQETVSYSGYSSNGGSKYYILTISDNLSIFNFANQINLLVNYKKDNLFKIINKLKKSRFTTTLDNTRVEKITKITNIGNQRIYNLTADDSNTYIANGIITHNTGGTEGSDFSGALEIIYNPIGYNVYALPNVFDKNSQGKQKTVFFFGAYLNRKGYYDKNGVSDITGALISILNSRYKTKYNTSDPTTITRVKAENPITIQDAIMKIEGTVYPVADLNDRLNEIDLEPRSLDDIFTGTLNFLNNEVIYKPDYNAIPIREFPHKNNKLLGSIEIHKMPEKGSDGKVMRGRYIGGIDTYDDDESDTLSLGSIYILDLFTDKIVCEYTGRPDFADEFYELCRKILLFYDAEANYENNKKGLYKYFSQHNCLYLLSDNLDFLREREGPVNTLRGNKAKGTLATGPIKNYYRTCIREWLTKPRKYIDDDGEEQVYTHLKELYSRALIKELILWNPDGNFDRHDALGMLMLLREEKLRVFGEDTPQDSVNFNDVDYLGNDEFFKANYENK
jgi:hypothetical protein